jgi:hypothetical protein
MMLELLAESALRSIVLGGAVWLGLTLLRVRGPRLQMTAWTVVLAASLAMPVVTPWLRIMLPADSPQTRLVKIAWANASRLAAPPWGRAAPAGEKFAPAGPSAERATDQPAVAAAASQGAPAAANDSLSMDALNWRAPAIAAYACVSGVMLLRLLFGWLVMGRVVRAARPICDGWAAGVDVRASDVVRVPVTFASTILLPPSYTAWSARRLRAVMLHEGSHVVHGDSYVLLLAAINRAVFWFNPFAWRLMTRLSDLAEMISDDDATAGLGDRRYYADTLLGVAADAQPLPSGLAMARPDTVRWRVNRVLSMTATPQPIGPRRRVAIAAAIVPMAALSAITLARGSAPVQTTTDIAGPAVLPGQAVFSGQALAPAAGIPAGIGAAQLDRYVGRFALAPSVLAITRDGEQLFAQLSGQPKLRLVPVNGHEFVDERGDSHLAFAIANEQTATAVALRAGNFAKRGVRIDAARADEMEAAFQRRITALAQRFTDQTPTPGGKAALLQMIDGLRHDPPSFERMNPQLADRMRRQMPELQPALEALGPPEQAFFRSVGPDGTDSYAVKFAKGSGDFRIGLAADGTIVDANVRPDGDGTPGGTANCAIESTLKASDGAAPIKLTLRNLTGVDSRLFSLDAAGLRTVAGELASDRPTDVLTAVGRPLVIADAAGQCREIVLPGQNTRFYGVGRSGTIRGLSGAWRNTPAVGSEEALLRHLDGIRRGLPDYDRMTPEAANATRQQLSQQRAILAKLGALRVISFRNVGPTGNDLYTLRFAEGSITWQIGLAYDGRIHEIWLGPG